VNPVVDASVALKWFFREREDDPDIAAEIEAQRSGG
jgi:hypothetical protein